MEKWDVSAWSPDCRVALAHENWRTGREAGVRGCWGTSAPSRRLAIARVLWKSPVCAGRGPVGARARVNTEVRRRMWGLELADTKVLSRARSHWRSDVGGRTRT